MRTNQDLHSLSMRSLFWRYALPAIISCSATSLYNLINRIFIGHGVGAYALSGLSLTLPLMNLAIAFSTLVGIGASALVSIQLGQQRKDLAQQTLGNALTLILILGGLISILSLIFLDPILIFFGASDNTLPYARDFMQIYLAGNIISNVYFGLYNIMRASGYPLKGMLGMLMTILINLILAPIFIFVLHWGMQGAALATVLAQICGLIYMLLHFCNKKHHLYIDDKQIRLTSGVPRKIFSIGLSSFVVHAGSFLVILIINKQLYQYGGDFAVGAGGIINVIGSLIAMIILGFAQGMQPIVGYNFGAKQYPRMWSAYRLASFWATIVTLSLWGVSMLFPNEIAKVFTSDKRLVEEIAHGLTRYMLLFPLIPIQMITSHFYMAIGKALISVLLTLLRQFLFLIPLLLWLPVRWGVDGVWFAEPIACFMATSVTIAVLIIFVRKFSSSLYYNFEDYGGKTNRKTGEIME